MLLLRYMNFHYSQNSTTQHILRNSEHMLPHSFSLWNEYRKSERAYKYMNTSFHRCYVLYNALVRMLWRRKWKSITYAHESYFARGKCTLSFALSSTAHAMEILLAVCHVFNLNHWFWSKPLLSLMNMVRGRWLSMMPYIILQKLFWSLCSWILAFE